MKLPKVPFKILVKVASKRSYDTQVKRKVGVGEWYITLHGTGNDFDTAKGNANYFSDDGTNQREAGANLFVDRYCAYKSVPLNRAPFAVGGNVWAGAKEAGGAKFYGKCTNYNSINIEMCDDMKDGIHDLSSETFENTARLVAYYSVKYNIPDDHIIRHWDVTGKPCPSYMIGIDNVLWKKFKERVAEIKNE